MLWFVKNFNRFPARLQFMWGFLLGEIAFAILLFTTGAMLWAVPFILVTIGFWVARLVPWGGKDMTTICIETVLKWEEDDTKVS